MSGESVTSADADASLDIKETLAFYADLINRALPGYIPACPFPESRIADAMAYSLLGGGKRIRGALLLAFYRLYAEDVRPALPFACALEMAHAYSLIHDDLPCMDDDDLRRGKPSCHIAFGEATALLAGDALLTLAFELMSSHARDDNRNDIGRVLRAIHYLASAAGVTGMIGGQAIDLEMEGKLADEDTIFRMYDKKTAALIRAACCIGCELGGATEEELNAASRYAGDLGTLFQISDDILDITADEAVLGKPVGSDLANAKSTIVGLAGLEEARKRVRALAASAAEALSDMPGDTGFLAALPGVLAEREK